MYNKTQLNPDVAFEKHVFHRDMFAHFLRWTHVLKVSKLGNQILDFGCGSGNLLEVLYRNRYKASKYLGLDIRQKTINACKEKWKNISWAEFKQVDLINDFTASEIGNSWDIIASFETIEHVGKQNGIRFLKNIVQCANDKTIILISTPNFDEKVGAAANHTYDAEDTRGIVPQEFTYQEMKEMLQSVGLKIENHWGTFASQRDYYPLMNDWQKAYFDAAHEYFDSNILSNLMSPLFPKHSRNVLWNCKLAC